MYCAACRGRVSAVTITEISEAYDISRSHLTKIVFELGAKGWLDTSRGRGGGMRLSAKAEKLTLEDIIKATETDFILVECFDDKTNQCALSGQCRLKGILGQAMQSYMLVLRQHKLVDLVPGIPQGVLVQKKPGGLHRA